MITREWLSLLKTASEQTSVIVQSTSDKHLLAGVGVHNLVLGSESAGTKIPSCILLYGTDARANEECSLLKATLQQKGVRVDTTFRKQLFDEKIHSVATLLQHEVT